MHRPIDEIAAELAGHGPHVHAAALRAIRDLEHRHDLDHAERWRATCRILDAVDLVEQLRMRAALGEYEPGA